MANKTKKTRLIIDNLLGSFLLMKVASSYTKPSLQSYKTKFGINGLYFNASQLTLIFQGLNCEKFCSEIEAAPVYQYGNAQCIITEFKMPLQPVSQ